MPEIVVDNSAFLAVRLILGDLDTPFVYDNLRLGLALRDNREIVLYRNPLFSTNSVFAYPILFYGRGQTPINKTDTVRSHLHPEPGKRSFQADRWCRHWDEVTPADVYKSAVLQTLNTDYTINYPEGRVTFTSDVGDYETVTASFAFYRVYHAARDVLMASAGTGAALTTIKLGSDSFVTGDISQQIEALNRLISNQTPRSFKIGHKVY